jgi:methyl-accepting chemotaxis protein
MTLQNSDNAKEVYDSSKAAISPADAGVENRRRISEAIDRIKASSESTAKMIKMIDEIAFPANLLALKNRH